MKTNQVHIFNVNVVVIAIIVVYLVVIESPMMFTYHRLPAQGWSEAQVLCSNMGSGRTGSHDDMAGKVVVDTNERRFAQQRQPQRIQITQSRDRFWTVGLYVSIISLHFRVQKSRCS